MKYAIYFTVDVAKRTDISQLLEIIESGYDIQSATPLGANIHYVLTGNETLARRQIKDLFEPELLND